ncbi:MAG: 3-dehydroquinate synthase [Acetobacter sp.]|nr:3-dehydroquinate synthase [Bacteroides sp.]MCM1340222.1 3-dehydroquinate synthase [Acetobacter sp.]MCM1432826.1 3-dehydroquinate synthase [Clostridiales bacterium]
MKKLTVNVNRKYDILIEKGLLSKAGELTKTVLSGNKITLISDTNVYKLYGETVKHSLQDQNYTVFTYIFEAGEVSKKPSTVIDMVEFMAEKGLTRGDGVVALGGGVCGDMAGFAASIFLRGIDFVQIPTTLLSQVDSSVGGKTGVDLPQGKNLCGAFHQPRLVIIDPNVLDTLTDHYFADGMGEVIKYGCIKSLPLFERLEKDDPKNFIEELIFDCVDIKRAVVENDEKEHGERALLNFGHTCGHAIEKLWDFKTVSHGEAVGIGMVMISRAGEKAGITEAGTADRIIRLLEKNNMKTFDTHSVDEIISAMSADKKRTSSGIKFAMLKSIGESFIMPVEFSDIPKMFGED